MFFISNAFNDQLFYALVCGLMLTVLGYDCFNFMQLFSYKLKRGYIKILKTPYFFGVLVVAVISFVLKFFIDNYYLIFSVISILGLIAFAKKRVRKTPLKFTCRIKRQIGFSFLCLAITCYFVNFYVVTLCLPLLLAIAFYLILPIELLINRYYILKAKKKLSAQSNLIIIAVVGSFGKTSVKNILSHILKAKYNVLISPNSYNTPLGLAKVINNTLEANTEVFIAEFGAKEKGDIKKLTKFINPDYVILTGIAPVHLDTFKVIDNIISTKFEAIKYLKAKGKAIFNGNNIYTKKYYDDTLNEKYLVTKNCQYKVISIDNKGSKFILNLDDQQILCNTVLLGEHNILNIALSSQVARLLNLSINEIRQKISTCEQIKHRLQLINNHGVNIIDDSYNCNLEGAKTAIDVLSQFTGKRIAVTSGIVEQGCKTYESNFILGQMLSDSDFVAVIGINTDALVDGLLDKNFDEDKLIKATTLNDAVRKLQPILLKGDTVLFMSDLPDNFV